MARIIIGFLVAPLAPTAALFVLLAGFHGIDRSLILQGVWVVMFSAIVTYPLALVLGVPILVAAVKFGFIQWYWGLVAGILIGTIVGAFFGFARNHPDYETVTSLFLQAAPLIALFAAWGAIVAAVFWAIARPDIYFTSLQRRS